MPRPWHLHGWFDVSIRDSGVGIAAEVLDSIFDPGYTTKGVGVGSGLGLSISYRVIEEHAGSIEVTSEPDEGTCVTIRMRGLSAREPIGADDVDSR